MTFRCERCHRTGRYPSWVSERYQKPTVHHCRYCGSAHSVSYGQAASAIGPALLPICEHGRLSPWNDGRYRPYVTGVFECEFRDGLRLRLRWTGRAWTWCGLIVDMGALVKWRGKWGES